MLAKQSIKQLLFRVVTAMAALAVASYGADDAYSRFSGQPLGKVKVNRYLAIPQKGGKFQFVYDGTEDRTCVNSLFPHKGNQPCWYLRKHTTDRIDM
jgi:hypothetical protein